MINSKDLKLLDKNYFDIIATSTYYVVLRSKNTGHLWHLLERDLNGHKSLVISHSHHASSPYHLQTNKPSIEACCEYIKNHDVYQLRKNQERKERVLWRREQKKLEAQQH